jgi:hypothetical protein
MGSGYEPHEMTRPDKLADRYMGKDYSNYKGRYATEITSRGVERLASAHAWGEMYRKDPDSAHFTLGQLADQ